ncbi:hypothetical protein FQZ97_888580 [compost metagenome]
MGAGESLQPLANRIGEELHRLTVQRLVVVHAPVVAVAAAGGQSQGREKPVETVDRTAADQRQRTVQLPMQGLQRHAQFARHMDRIGGLGDIQEGTVDIEKQ